ncbi:MAG: ABC transporter substrate-binding protein [Planctomycetes bacterium]|nr:ABC transporter substrate-binding protein [Planctomycetota bacterium]
MPDTRLLTLGHSPDPDDAFMHYALAADRIDTAEFRFQHILEDIETLNKKALRGEYDISAVSIHAFAYCMEHYLLLPHGASMGDRYGPKIVSKGNFKIRDLKKARIAVPGTMTTAYLVARLALGDFHFETAPFDAIPDLVAGGKFDAGILIHEGQLTYQRLGLQQILDLGEWFAGVTGGLPLPLGGNAIKRSLGKDTARVSGYLKKSIAYGLEHREEALAHSLKFGRGLDAALNDQFVGMYVNNFTLDYGDRGRAGVKELLKRAHEAGLVPDPVDIVFAGVE